MSVFTVKSIWFAWGCFISNCVGKVVLVICTVTKNVDFKELKISVYREMETYLADGSCCWWCSSNRHDHLLVGCTSWSIDVTAASSSSWISTRLRVLLNLFRAVVSLLIVTDRHASMIWSTWLDQLSIRLTFPLRSARMHSTRVVWTRPYRWNWSVFDVDCGPEWRNQNR